MKNNTSFLLVAATVFAGVLLSFGRIADFGSAPAQATAIATAKDPVAARVAEQSHRSE
jgi:hypothetical protein